VFDQLVASLTVAAPRKSREIRAGDVFTRLTATAEVMKDSYGTRLRFCVCSCGNDGWFRESQLRAENSKSCGCYRRDRAIEMLVKAREAASKNVVRGVDGKFRRQDN
jgi:hypothetical protein